MTLVKDLYKSLFGKNYAPMWREFANDINGTLTIQSEFVVRCDYNGFVLIFDTFTHYTTVGASTYDTEYIRCQVEVISTDNLKFRLTPQGLLEDIGKWFGAQDIVIRDRDFDNKFMIKGSDDYKIQQFLSSVQIKNFLLRDKLIRFELTDEEGIIDVNPSAGHSMLYYVSNKKITNISQLKDLYLLLTESVDKLVKLRSIKVIKAST